MAKYNHPARNPIIFLILFIVIAAVFLPISQGGRSAIFTKNTEKNKFKLLFRAVRAQGSQLLPLSQTDCEEYEEYIVFTSTRDGNYEIYTMKPDGSELHRLTYSLEDNRNLVDDYNPSISPDGQKIAFESRRDNDYEIYVMNYDGSDQTRITFSEGGDGVPSWSPDGKRIAFTSWRDGNSEIYVMDADGANQINLTNNPADDFAAAWAPDGNTIVFESSRHYDYPLSGGPIFKIYTVTTDGLVEKIVDDPGVGWPDWSPDGQNIAFIYYPGQEIYYQEGQDIPISELHIREFTADIDTVLETNMGIDGHLAWSPDGGDILFSSYIDNAHGQIYRISADGSNLTQLTSSGDYNGNGDWQRRCISQTPVAQGNTSTATPAPQENTPTATLTSQENTSSAELGGIKSYLLGKIADLKVSSENLKSASDSYYELAEASNFDYAALWENHPTETTKALTDARSAWMAASPLYEQVEGIVAGIPSLSEYDVILDAGASGVDDPENTVPFDLTLPDGRVLPKPGNLFDVLESTLWGTNPDYAIIGVEVDFNANGMFDFGEILPDANVLKGAADLLDSYISELDSSAQAWEPTESDAFTALVVMAPTISQYFESWKNSHNIADEESTQSDFVVISRLSDIQDILSSLQIVYAGVKPLIININPDQALQIESDLNSLKDYVADIYQQEQEGRRFTTEEADVLALEVQNRTTIIAEQVSQAAAALNIEIEE
jgi:Tol biopolymer transport system component